MSLLRRDCVHRAHFDAFHLVRILSRIRASVRIDRTQRGEKKKQPIMCPTPTTLYDLAPLIFLTSVAPHACSPFFLVWSVSSCVHVTHGYTSSAPDAAAAGRRFRC